jgi:hypothetical protein
MKQLINDQLSYLKHKSNKSNLNITTVTIPEEDFIDRVGLIFDFLFIQYE